jgi:hypothetical protein
MIIPFFPCIPFLEVLPGRNSRPKRVHGYCLTQYLHFFYIGRPKFQEQNSSKLNTMISKYFINMKRKETETIDGFPSSSSSSSSSSAPSSPKMVKTNYEDNIQELAEKGYTGVKGVISKEKCDKYYDALWAWLASLGTGIDFEDRKTWNSQNWPFAMHGI